MKSNIANDVYLVLIADANGQKRHAATVAGFADAASYIGGVLNFLTQDDVAAIRLVRASASELAALAGKLPMMRQQRQLSGGRSQVTGVRVAKRLTAARKVG